MSSQAAARRRTRPYYPASYHRRMPIFWWLGRLSYTRFIVRELTSLAVAYSAVLLVVQAWAVRQGPGAYAAFAEWLQTPWVLAFHGFVLAVLVFHTVTWLGLAPKALVLRVRGRRVPDRAVVAGHYLAWAVASALVLWTFLGS